jgi:hypothetical protein
VIALFAVMARAQQGTRQGAEQRKVPGVQARAGGGIVLADPARMRATGSVDPRYASFNVEMAEVTGGRFWKPYHASAKQTAGAAAHAEDHSQPPGMSDSLYQYRPPIDLSNPRLRMLARELGASYLRVSGTWANSTWFQDDDLSARATPPEGFRSVLTRAEWKGVLEFLHATGDSLVTSFAISAGTRNAQGEWTPEQARAWIDYTHRAGGTVAAAEFMNEPTFPTVGGAPTGYDAAQFARDAKSFAEFLRQASPKTIFLGPGSVGEGTNLLPPGTKMKLMHTDAILQATGPIFDAFSYHFYGAASRRCMGTTTVAQAMTDEWLDSTVAAEQFYAELRDRYMPGKPMWLTETAEAACGGDEFAGQFVDIFRYLNQLGALAQHGVKVVMHNTLAASDYGLLDERTLEPRPDYWATLIWKRTMGRTVLDPGWKVQQDMKAQPGIHVFAHCALDGGGAVSVLVLNTRASAVTLQMPEAAQRGTLTAPSLTSTHVLLNGKPLATRPDGSVMVPSTVEAHAGLLTLPPASASFLTFARAGNAACR